MSTGRKPAAFNTNHFTQVGKKQDRSQRWLWKCKHCGDEPDSKGASLEGRDNLLPRHIADSRECPNAPSTARQEALRFMADKKKTDEPTTSQGKEGGNSVIDVDALDATGAGVTVSRKRKAGTLDNYVDHTMTTAQKNAADRKFLRFIIHANIAFVTSENPYLDAFLHDLRPSYDPPRRYSL
ncbi:hypothetical protein DFH06DRAFT_992033, partial [Mycena polygramma]